MYIMENVVLYTCLHMTVANSTSPPTEIPTNGTTTVYCSSGYYCYNGGTCNGSYSCICPDGYQGYDCSRMSCEYPHSISSPAVVVHYLFLHCVSPKVKDFVQTMELVLMVIVIVHLDILESIVN